jgi:predicted DNA-binding protein (UPF0251 family)
LLGACPRLKSTTFCRTFSFGFNVACQPFETKNAWCPGSIRWRAAPCVRALASAELPGEEPESLVASETGLAAFAAAAVARLPSPYREALTLTELQGVTQLAASKLLGISPSGMKSRVQRGREKLRQLIESSCDISLDVRGGVIACEPKAQCSCTGREG